MKWIFLVNISRLILKARELGIKVICFTFYRSPEDQAAEFAAGKSRTLTGFHPVWCAMDLAIIDDLDGDLVVDKSELHWDFDARYVTLGQYWESLGGIWGGRWKDPCDPYHFQYSDQLRP